jgi:hypothetical protein
MGAALPPTNRAKTDLQLRLIGGYRVPHPTNSDRAELVEALARLNHPFDGLMVNGVFGAALDAHLVGFKPIWLFALIPDLIGAIANFIHLLINE